MADLPPRPADQFAGKEPPADHDETNWGEDWESAFQAEDEVFFSEGKDEDFFLESKESVVPAAAGQQPDPSLEKTLSGPPAQNAVSPGVRRKSPAVAEFLASLFLAGKTAAQQHLARLSSFPLFIRLPIYALPLLLVGIGMFFALSGPPDSAPVPVQPFIPPASPPGTAPASSGETASFPGETAPLPPGKVRKRWAFPAFIIPAHNPAPDQPVIFLHVDITLIAALDEQEELPADRKVFVRDIIFQFYQNKPLAELRRFSLARGEMNRELRAWLRKQWPEAPVESILFNRYHLS
jgi:hypothetical protein